MVGTSEMCGRVEEKITEEIGSIGYYSVEGTKSNAIECDE